MSALVLSVATDQTLNLALADGGSVPAVPVPNAGGSGSGGPLGSFTVDPNNGGEQQSFGWVPVLANTTVVLFDLSPPIAQNEVVEVACDVHFTSQEGGEVGYQYQQMMVTNVSGTITNPVGGTLANDTTPGIPNNLNSALTGAKATLLVNDAEQTLRVTMLAPPAVDLFAKLAWLNVIRGVLPGTPPRATVTAATYVSGPGNATSGPGSGGTVIDLKLSPGSTGVTKVTNNGLNVPFAIEDGTTVRVTMPNFSGTAPSTAPWIVFNGGGPGNDTTAGFTYTSSAATSFDIMGGVAAGTHTWFAKNATHSGGTLLTVPDANTTNPANMVLTGTLGFLASSATWTPAQPAVTTPGTLTDIMNTGVMTVAATDSLFAWFVVKWTSANASGQTLFSYSSVSQQFFFNNTAGSGLVDPTLTDNARAAVAIGAGNNRNGKKSFLWGFSECAAAGAGGHLEISLNNATPVQSTGTGPVSTVNSSGINMGIQCQLELVEWGFARFPAGSGPTPTQLTQLDAWVVASYGAMDP